MKGRSPYIYNHKGTQSANDFINMFMISKHTKTAAAYYSLEE
jgi:hypothetical protein